MLIETRTRSSVILIIFGVFAIISSLTAPDFERFFSNEFFKYKIIIQQIFWIVITLFITKNLKYFSFYQVTKFLFWGLILLNVNFFFFNFNTPAPIKLLVNRNSYVFTMVAIYPIVSYYIYHRYGLKGIKRYVAIVLFAVLISNGRAGGILIFGESILILAVFFRKTFNYFKILFFTFFLLNLFVISFIDFEDIRKDVAKPISKIAPRISEFISGEGMAGDLDHDRSWLLRELMIEKGIEIVYKYPFLGVGLFNFANYDAKLNSLYENEKFYSVLHGQVNTAEKFNDKSAHNSYVQLISENGIIGFSLYILLVFPLLYIFLKKLLFSGITINDLPLMSFFFLSIYFYAIASLMGTLTYVIIGLAIASKNKQIRF